jgi:hypothetical protein
VALFQFAPPAWPPRQNLLAGFAQHRSRDAWISFARFVVLFVPGKVWSFAHELHKVRKARVGEARLSTGLLHEF